jgi:hypothetical protein
MPPYGKPRAAEFLTPEQVKAYAERKAKAS